MHFHKKIDKLFFFLFLFFIFMMPLGVSAYSSKLYVGGENIGISVKSDGILIVGFYKVGNSSPGEQAGLKIGDRIIMIDNNSINEVDELSKHMKKEDGKLNITYLRSGKEYNTVLQLIKNKDNVYKTGLYVKDSIIGIGTLTFIDPANMMFGALGHEIIEKSTNRKFVIKDGSIFKSIVTDIDKSSRNNPGEKNATFYSKVVYGSVNKNTISGIYGTYTSSIDDKELLNVSQKEEVKTGPAFIRTVIDGTKIEEFAIDIVRTNLNSETKNILFEITDKNLLAKTNGIVQGMSGSPIIQNNKIVGAVTHVVVDNPIKGYGIFITNMLEEIENKET